MDFLHIVEEVKESTTKANSKAKGPGIFSVNTYVGIFSTVENAQPCNCLVSFGGKVGESHLDIFKVIKPLENFNIAGSQANN